MFYDRVTRGSFHDAFQKLRPDNFSHQGLNALYEYCLELGHEMENGLELDVIGLCCDFTEYKDFEEFRENNSGDWGSWEDVAHDTTVIVLSNTPGAIVQNI